MMAKHEEWRLKAENNKVRGIGRNKCNLNKEE